MSKRAVFSLLLLLAVSIFPVLWGINEARAERRLFSAPASVKGDDDGAPKTADDEQKAFDEKKAALLKSARKADVGAWLELGNWAQAHGLVAAARETYEKVLTFDPNHAEAHKALGHVQYLGQWMPRERMLKLTGQTETNPSPKDDKPPANSSTPKDEPEPPRVLPPKPPPGDLGWKWIPCSDCNGTGYTDWLECHQCARSGRPGYVNLGEQMAVCNRCQGKGKLPGLRCARCTGGGRVRSDSRPLAPSGRMVLKGYALCPDCNGTGCETFLPCNQCARSRKPGYVDMGDHLEVCPRCRGKARLPGVLCRKCKGSGICREEDLNK